MFRRPFIGWLVALIALPNMARAASRRLRLAAKQRALPSQGSIRALGEAVLPRELGRARMEVASDAFWRWMSGYREGAELLHPYGSPRISYSASSPVPNWTKQLRDLDRSAKATHGASFALVGADKRQGLVRAALQEIKDARLDDVVSAPHIALGLLAHFYGSSEATDLCYRAHIGRNRCRPLVHNGRKPLQIASP